TDHDRLTVRHLPSARRLHDLVDELETGSSNPPHHHPDLELVTEHRLRPIVTLRPRDDHTRERIRQPRQLAPARETTLFEVREVPRMIAGPQALAAAKADGPARAKSGLQQASYNPAAVPSPPPIPKTSTADETRALEPYFTNTDRPVFALRNLPETV